MIVFAETTVIESQEANVLLPKEAGSLNIDSAWGVGTGLSLFSGSFGPKEERSIHTIIANVGEVTVSTANSVDLEMEVLWKTADFNGPTTLSAVTIAHLH